MSVSSAIRIGVSSCLLGQRVRYDGGDKRDAFAADALARTFMLVPVCPELGIGLGVPRPPIELHGDPRAPRARIHGNTDLDVTSALSAYGTQTATAALADIAGYVFKSKSPSCALSDSRVYTRDGEARGRGLFARALTGALPALPCEDEARLQDPRVRETFVERVLAYAQWQALARAGLTPGALVAFHSAHKFTLMAHGADAYRALGRRIARAGGEIDAVASDYLRTFMAALRTPATRGRHADVLMHLLGFFKRRLDAEQRRIALAAIRAYRRGEVSRREPLALLHAHLARYPHPYVARQSYLDPLPLTLAETP